MSDFLDEFANTAAWIGIALGLMAVGFIAVDLLTPGKLRSQVSSSLNAAILVAAKVVAVGIIVAVAIFSSIDDSTDSMVEAVLYSGLGLVVSAAGFLLLDWILPVRLRHLVDETRFDPAVVVAAGSEVAIALVIAAAIS